MSTSPVIRPHLTATAMTTSSRQCAKGPHSYDGISNGKPESGVSVPAHNIKAPQCRPLAGPLQQ